MALTRIDKLLSDSGRVSRSEAKELIRTGRVAVNGAVPASSDEKFDPDTDRIEIDGEAIDCARFRYIMMYKPNGVLSATEDGGQQTVLDLLPAELKKQGLFPVGRLDKDTTGLLILTNDGDFAHRVISPKHHVPKRYRAAVDGVLDEADIAAFEKGLLLSDGTQCLPAQLVIERPSVGVVTVFEGKYHQVKRMFASRGKHVTALHRFSIGGLVLDPGLEPGNFAAMDKSTADKVFGISN